MQSLLKKCNQCIKKFASVFSFQLNDYKIFYTKKTQLVCFNNQH